jgi:hypothetical protein
MKWRSPSGRELGSPFEVGRAKEGNVSFVVRLGWPPRTGGFSSLPPTPDLTYLFLNIAPFFYTSILPLLEGYGIYGSCAKS